MQRIEADYEDHSKRKFLTNNVERSQQYFKVYNQRIKKLHHQTMDRVKYLVATEWQNKYIDPKYLFSTAELNNDEYVDQLVVIVGTLYKEGRMKPNILDEYTRDYILLDDEQLNTLQGKQSYITPEDQLFLEDDHGRLSLIFTNEKQKENLFRKTFSGAIVSVIGKRDPQNSDNLITQEIVLPGFPSLQNPYPPLKEEKYIAFISSMEIDTSLETQQNAELIVRYLAGFFGSKTEQHILSRICRLVIVGDLVKEQEKSLKGSYKVKGSLRGTELTSRVEPIQTVDHFLSKLGQSMEIDIMPGKYDPTNVALPQQPINRCLFEACSQLNTVHMVTNPYHFSLDGVNILGVCGQPVHDIQCYTEGQSSVDIAETLINCSHIAPTAPDTLNSFPFVNDDPFVIDVCPNVFFVGNQEEYGYRWVEQRFQKATNRVLCISLPKFSTQKCIVLLNLQTLEPSVIKIS